MLMDRRGAMTEELPATRAEAKRAGAKHYFTGKPCPHGHVSIRHVGNGECVECGRNRAVKWGRDNKESVATKNASYYASNKKKENARTREYKAKNKLSISAYNSRYWLENMDVLKERDRVYNLENRNKLREWNRQFHKNNPTKNAEYHQRRRALHASAEGYHTAEDIANIIKKQGGLCACCKRVKSLAVDHIVALTKGGSNWPNNLQMLCKSCNSKKRTKDNDDFMRSMGMAA
jgi:5-methylcytosine-specific restriction endonuclease McrA